MNFFDDWTGVARLLVIGPIAYAALVVVLRTSGKRTLSKMNAFDLVLTVALGSTLSTAVLDDGVPLIESVVVFVVFAALQAIVAWAQTRSARIENLVKSEPRLLVRNGRLLDTALRRERVSEAEVLQALRSEGRTALEDVAAVVLESDGSLSVIGQAGESGPIPGLGQMATNTSGASTDS